MRRDYERPTLVRAGAFRAKTGCTERKPGGWWEWIGPNYQVVC